MLLLEKSPHFSLSYDQKARCLYACWQGHHTGELTRANYEAVLRQVRATQSTQLLNDGTLDENGWSELTEWLADFLFKELAQAGIQAIAWVLPYNPDAFYDTFQVLHRLEQPLVDTFADVEAAYYWLRHLALPG